MPDLSTLKLKSDGATWLTGKLWNALIDALVADRARLIQGSGDEIPTKTGRWFHIRPGTNGDAASRVPLEPYDASDESDLRIRITYGTIGGLELDDYGPVIITATSYFYGKLTVDDDGVPLSLELLSNATIPATMAASDTFLIHHVYLGRAVVAVGAISDIDRNLAGSQGYERCGWDEDYSHSTWVT